MARATRLRKLKLTRVDTVTAGANVDRLTGEGAKILLYKSAESATTENGGAHMPTEDEQLAQLRKATDAAVAAAVDAAVAPVKTELANLRKQYDTEKADFEAAVSAAADPEKIDKSALPEPVRKRLEELEAQAKTDRDAVAKMADERDAARWATVAKGLTHVAVAKQAGGDGPGELAQLLQRIEKDAGAETAERVTEVLAAAEAKVSDSKLLSEVGAPASGGPLSDADTALDQAAAALMQTDPALTKAAAISKAAIANPQLAERVLLEMQRA